MARGNVGQRVRYTITALKEDGTPGETGGDPTWTVDDSEVTEVVKLGEGDYAARLLAQGSSKITALQPKADGTSVELVGIVICNDPADDATIFAITEGAVEDDPGDGEPV